MSWTENGPVSLPPRSLAYGAAAAVALAALIGTGIGFRAGWRGEGSPAVAGADQSQSADTAVPAQPIVDVAAVQQPPSTNAAASNAVSQDQEEAASNDIAVKTAAAQAIQSKQATSTATIDEILTPPTEKPQAPAKPTTDEGAPGAPPKSDVPF